MNYYLGLILLSACMSLSWADDFRLSFSREIIEADDQQPGDLDDLSLLHREKPDDPAATPPKQEKTDPPHTSAAEISEKTQELSESKAKSGSRVYPARFKPLDPVNNFLPIQDVPANHFWGREMLAGSAGLENDYRHADGQNQMESDLFDQLHDEMRLMVGEDIYAKMVWTYLDVKQLDNWIYTTINQSELFAQDSLIVGLNDQLMASLTSWGLAESNNQKFLAPQQFNSRQIDAQVGELNHAKPSIDSVLMKADFESRSSFFWVLGYLTVENLLYLMLSIVAFVSAGKMFKFLVRQQ